MAERSGRDSRIARYEDAWQQLYLALRVLAGAGDIRERLIKAWRSGMHRLADHHLDNNLTAELTAIREALTAWTDPETGKGSVAATVAKMSEEEASHWSMRIMDLAVDLTRLTAGKP